MFSKASLLEQTQLASHTLTLGAKSNVTLTVPLSKVVPSRAALQLTDLSFHLEGPSTPILRVQKSLILSMLVG